MVAMDLHPAPLHRQTPEHHGADQPTPAALVAGQVAAVVESILPEISRSGTLTPAGGTPVPFDIARDIRFLPKERLPYHVNALTIRAWGGSPSSGSVESGAPSSLLLERTYYSVGGGFVMVQTTEDPQEPRVESLATPGTAGTLDVSAPHPFTTSAQLLASCDASGMSIAHLVRANEESMRSPDLVEGYLDLVADEMFTCADAGSSVMMSKFMP